MIFDPIRNPYEHLLQKVLTEGKSREDRTGTGTLSLFGHQMRFDLEDGFPLVTTKKVSFDVTAKELLFFLSGESSAKPLQDQGVKIWDDWSDANGDLGPIYGVQWRKWRVACEDCVGEPNDRADQIANVIESIKTNPYSRRHIVSAWNVGDLELMALVPCHAFFQFYVSDGKLSCQLYQRSADTFLGVPYNIASYALLTHMIAAQTGLGVGEFVWTGGDVHLYQNHIEQAKEQLSRKPYPLPTLELDPAETIDHYTRDHMRVVNYQHHPAIKAKVSV